MKPLVLDLFCGAGGASRGYAMAGFQPIGVDIKPQKHYPYPFILGKAGITMAILLEGGVIHASRKGSDSFVLQDFSLIHASPPCQAYSSNVRGLSTVPHPKYIKATRTRLQAAKVPFIIENVVGAPLIKPIMLCGSSFGMRVRRHRLFESNAPLVGLACEHRSIESVINIYSRENRAKLAEEAPNIDPEFLYREDMGIDWMTLKEGRQAIPPAFTHFLGAQIMRFYYE